MNISEGLKKLIDASLADGKIRSKERMILVNKAVNEGLDKHEFELYLDGLRHARKKEATSANIDKAGTFLNKVGAFFKWISEKKSRVIVAAIIVLFLIIFIPECGSTEIEKQQEKYQTEFKCDNVEDCLTQYNFDGARAYASILEYSWDKNDAMQKIISSEVNYYISNDEYEKAKTSALEAGKFFIYKDALPNAINNLIDKEKVSDAISILSKYTFEQAYELDGNNHYNNSYNDEANYYNDMINSVFTNALFNENKDVLKKCLLLYVPITEDKKVNSTSKVVHSSKTIAKGKLKEAGIVL
jgi:hypothetical protein